MSLKPKVRLPRKGQQIDMAYYLNNKSLKRRAAHGGQPTIGKRKTERPLDTKSPIHLMLKASKAKGQLSFLYKQNEQHVRHIIEKQARKFFVKIRDYANVGNHLHLEIEITARKEFKQFLRSITCMIARKITGARKGKKFGKFWDHLAFTRIVRSYKEQQLLERYIMANKFEAIGGPLARARVFDYWFGQRELLYG